jgi:hypothetical protein
MALSDEQVQLLQAFIDDKRPGTYDAMDLIPEDFLEYFAAPTVHGAQFADAVRRNKFNGVVSLGMDMGSKHMRYALHGG